ncbi:DUF2238 domain-containing protein [Candidatus Parcubacteria bacterium]|nr:DUF2238 domain-containing protein [Candidatus Parcubacteria bacterium]
MAYRTALFLAFSLVWIYLAIDPADRLTWALDNIAVVFAALAIWRFGPRFSLSNLSYTFLFVFLALHCIGTHFGYEHVPWGNLIGDPGRNDYDRLVHFSFGLFAFLPLTELAKGWYGSYRQAFLVSLLMIFSLAALYEIFEWLAAIFLHPAESRNFLGSQGDYWDTQKDMAMAVVGAFVAAFGAAVGRRVTSEPAPRH